MEKGEQLAAALRTGSYCTAARGAHEKWALLAEAARVASTGWSAVVERSLPDDSWRVRGEADDATAPRPRTLDDAA